LIVGLNLGIKGFLKSQIKIIKEENEYEKVFYSTFSLGGSVSDSGSVTGSGRNAGQGTGK
jgi:hypothetical protein